MITPPLWEKLVSFLESQTMREHNNQCEDISEMNHTQTQLAVIMQGASVA